MRRKKGICLSDSNGIIRIDSFGVMRVGDTRISLDSVVSAFLQGHSPVTIQEQYPGLTLEQVQKAVDYYLAHRSDVDEYLERQAEVWRKLREESEKNPAAVVDRLRALRLSEVEP
jgi:uncharacterized protein (DUF433 family)